MYKIKIIALSQILMISCDSGDHIRTYRLPKPDKVSNNNIIDEKNKNDFSLKWKTPDTWIEVQGHSMRLASFNIPLSDGNGDVSITTFSGISGGIEANVNRWLGQIGLEPLSLVNIQKISLAGTGKLGDYKYFKLINDDKKETAILASIFQLEARTVFVKLSINAGEIIKVESDFRSFCESIFVSG